MRTSTLLKLIIAGVFFVLAAVFPLIFPDPTLETIGFVTLTSAAAATGWNLFSGYSGYLALGGGTYFGFGAYTMALLCQYWHMKGGYDPFWLVPLGGLVAAIVAIPIGWISLHARKATFIVITIATLFIFQLLAYNLTAITGGSFGINLPGAPWRFDFYSVPFYYMGFALLIASLLVSWWIRTSKYGLGLLAIREDEDRALGLGVKTGIYKLSAFVISAFFAGAIGALNIYFDGLIGPPAAFTPVFGTAPALMAFIGGVGTLSGPVLGALILEPLHQVLLQNFSATGIDIILYGVLLLLVLLYLPEGIIPGVSRLWTQWRKAGKAQRPTTLPESRLVESTTAGRE
ncbi:branched-chain amino acid ABC transporter permease [Tengunoibacter tsumagoiensis]|uniref:Branched-chain amino acid ABC transporter permease n=1 Tax=Tengunoibacter tsumagoiensis TaxID=2014871 RepID=A0A402A3S1_9CHLR|nr:branched-chain amino acid ABC transporter permease [Tengunoibacter tsumagoiensis]GCE13797.1 branched-chain amino acid ABC transporter permease [Tengunoibacter tsumagoiensis]